MKVRIKTIPHNVQRYNTSGDYWERNGTQIRISELGNEDYHFLIAIHELIEQYLTQRRGIKEKDITKFDKEFELNRKPWNDSEPGDSPSAPYRREHQFATTIERLISNELEVDWDEYGNAINNLLNV